jgi:chromosome segregation ATPase
MTSSSKDRGSNGRDDCQIHVDKEGESCVIKIESVGQEKMLKELLGRISSLKGEVNQLLTGQQKQQQSPKEMHDAIQEMTAKLKPLEDQLQKVNKHVGDDHLQLNKIHTDLNKKFDEIKQDLNSFKEQQKSLGPSKDTMDKILQKLDNLGRSKENKVKLKNLCR